MTEELIRIRVCGIDKDGAGREYSITVPSGSTAMEAALEGARKFGLQMPEEAALSLWGRRADPSAPLSDGDRVEITLPLTIDPNDARRLRAADAGLQLVFVTGYAEHVFDGYSVGALGYLLKPPKAEQLEEVLDRAQAALVRDLDRAYICRSGDTHYRIPIANILYFVSDRRQVACVTAGREYTFYGKLDTVAAEVGADFVRIHQRYLVRTGAVDRMEGGEVVLRDGRRLPVSRSCQPSALLAFTRAELEG